MKFWRRIYQWKKVISYTIITTLIASGIYHYYQKLFLFLPLREIRIKGTNNFHFAEQNLPNKGQPIVTVQLQKLYDIAKKSPWVESLIIRRIFPYTLNIQVIEYIPFAVWNNNMIITKEGYEITKQIDDLQLLSVHGKSANINAFHFIKSLSLDTHSEIKKLEYIGERRWNVIFNNNFIVKLPDQDYQNAWHKALEIIEKHHLLQSKIKYLDMRLTDKIFIKQ